MKEAKPDFFVANRSNCPYFLHKNRIPLRSDSKVWSVRPKKVAKHVPSKIPFYNIIFFPLTACTDLVQNVLELLPDVLHHLQHRLLGLVVEVTQDVHLAHSGGEGAGGGANATVGDITLFIIYTKNCLICSAKRNG